MLSTSGSLATRGSAISLKDLTSWGVKPFSLPLTIFFLNVDRGTSATSLSTSSTKSVEVSAISNVCPSEVGWSIERPLTVVAYCFLVSSKAKSICPFLPVI